MPVPTRRCHKIRPSVTVLDVPRPATGKTFIARARVPLAKWERFEEAPAEQGTDRSKLINEFIDWYLRERGAVMPERPARRRPATAVTPPPASPSDTG